MTAAGEQLIAGMKEALDFAFLATKVHGEMRMDVKIKPLEWQGDYSHTALGLFYHVDHATGTPGFVVLEKIEGASTTKSAWPTIDKARAAAQDDYEQRIMSALLPS